MTPERLRQIEDVFHAARERAPSERSIFLAEACAGDPALRREVESLLGQQPAGVIDTPVAALAAGLIPDAGPRLEPGFTLGPYRVESLISAGGMGEVYRARDLTLGRDVAIKVLPRHFTIDHERLSRFAREARLLAALNHPNIAAIYGVEESDDVRALVLELVNGPTLADLLTSGPLPIAEALRIARQITDALAAAHEKGIVHRDLKPANIALTPDGVVKLLDFGLGRTDVGAAASERSGAPTLTLDATRHGLIVGTAAYMSPEQARGKTVDKRTDIWSFGCVLFELLAGCAAFRGETTSDTIVAILERDAAWGLLPPAVPAAVRRLLERCLEKDPGARLRDIGDARLDLIEVTSGTPRGLERRRALANKERWFWIAAAVIGIAVAATARFTRDSRNASSARSA